MTVDYERLEQLAQRRDGRLARSAAARMRARLHCLEHGGRFVDRLWCDGWRSGESDPVKEVRVDYAYAWGAYCSAVFEQRVGEHKQAHLERLKGAALEAGKPKRKAKRNPYARAQRDSRRQRGYGGFISDPVDYWATCFPKLEGWLIRTVCEKFKSDERRLEVLGNCLIVAERLAARKSKLTAAEQARFDDCPALVYKRAVCLWLRENRGRYCTAHGNDVTIERTVTPLMAAKEQPLMVDGEIVRQTCVDVADTPRMRLMPLAEAMLGDLGEKLATHGNIKRAAEQCGIALSTAYDRVEVVREKLIRGLQRQPSAS